MDYELRAGLDDKRSAKQIRCHTGGGAPLLRTAHCALRTHMGYGLPAAVAVGMTHEPAQGGRGVAV